MGLDVYSRREYKQGKFIYLLDDEEKTLNGACSNTSCRLKNGQINDADACGLL